MPSIITGPFFYYFFFSLLICHCILTSGSDFYTISPEYVIGRKSPSHAVQSKQEKWKCVVLKKQKNKRARSLKQQKNVT